MAKKHFCNNNNKKNHPPFYTLETRQRHHSQIKNTIIKFKQISMRNIGLKISDYEKCSVLFNSEFYMLFFV